MTILDPCCGSGHFLAEAFRILVPMRMAAEGLSARDAATAVLRDNLFGLEIDERCTQIAAFNLALVAWAYPGAGGYRPLPELNIACSGLSLGAKEEEWLKLAGKDERLREGMRRLYQLFKDAPTLGSLLDPRRKEAELFRAGFEELQPLLKAALESEELHRDATVTAAGIAAQGMARSGALLARSYTLVTTNVPYLSRARQSARLMKFSESQYGSGLGKNELAYTFLHRILNLLVRRCTAAVVLPQNFLYMHRYTAFRRWLLASSQWNLIARLGARAFETIGGEVVNVGLFLFSHTEPHREVLLRGLDLPTDLPHEAKPAYLQSGRVESVNQLTILQAPDSVFSFSVGTESVDLLEKFAECYQGLRTGDAKRFARAFWELRTLRGVWDYFQTSGGSEESVFSGYTSAIRWEGGEGKLAEYAKETRAKLHDMHESGNRAWGRKGVAIGQITLRSTAYFGDKFDNPIAVIVPRNTSDLLPLWCFLNDLSYKKVIKERNRGLYVTNAALLKVPFDIDNWRAKARERYPKGILSGQLNDDPTQWIFHGHARFSRRSLQVAVARLLGYRWPAENDPEIELDDEARAWVEEAKAWHPFEDDDGIVCIPAVCGEQPANERLLQLLQASWGCHWRDGILAELLAGTGSANLDDWLRNEFFDEHCKLFQERPFVWHIWDGRKRDGFHALVNYHKLAEGNNKGRRLLESLTYSYLGDWTARQQDGVRCGERGAEDRLAAAEALKARLAAILEGEPPYDIAVRWKPLREQAIGWEPDLYDGVRINIRPFVGAGVLRKPPRIKWTKDHGKEPRREREDYPWFWLDGAFTGERVNDVHLTHAEKYAARDRAAEGQEARR